MNILRTNIPDLEESIDKQKVDLADKILEVLIPLMNQKYQDKIRKIKELKKTVVEKKKEVNNKKTDLEILLKEYSKKKKVKTLLERIMKLLGSGLLVGEFKKEMIVVLKSIEQLNEEKLDYYLAETYRVFNKKHSETN